MAVARQMPLLSFCRLLTLPYPLASIRLRAWPSVKLLAPATGAAVVRGLAAELTGRG
jgi:hypothetical protein